MKSIGNGKIMVEFFSAEIEFKVCKYRNCSAEEDSAITSEASLRALDAFCSPSAAMTFALASRAASASAAMARWSWTGRRASLISTLSTLMPHAAVASSNTDCMEKEMLSRSLKISCRFFVPRMFRNVV